MANSTIETVWKLTLDENEARSAQSAVERLANAVQDKLGSAGTAAIDKTTDAIRAQTDALKEEEAQASATGKAVASSSSGGGIGKPSELISKFSGVGRMAGVNLEQFAGIARAGEGLKQLAEAAGLVGTASEAAGVASAAAAPGLLASAAGFVAVLAPLAPLVIAIGAVVAALAILKSADDQRAEDINKQADLQRAISDEIAAGATKEDIEERIQALKDRDDLEKRNLEENKKKYDDYLESVRNAAGGLGRFLEPLIRLFGSEEQALADQVDKSQKLLDDNADKEKGYQEALDRGDTAKNDAKKREEELADARQKSANETAKAADKAQRDQEAAQRKQEQAAAKAQAAQDKAAADAQRAAEQQAQKQQQIDEKRYQAAQKYSDSLIDIARKSADDAEKALTGLKEKLSDNRAAALQDLQDLSAGFADSEREEAIKRGEQEVQDAIDQTRKLESIRDDAMKSEQDALRQRDFLSAPKIREAANTRIEQENKTFQDAQADKQRAQKAEDAAQLRQLDKARRDRMQALDRANAEAKLAYQRDLNNQKDARRIAEREAGIARDRELRAANEQARALLGIKTQAAQAELQLAQSTLNSLRGMGGVTNNNQRTMNGDVHFNMSGISGQGISPQMIQTQILQTLGSIGLA